MNLSSTYNLHGMRGNTFVLHPASVIIFSFLIWKIFHIFAEVKQKRKYKYV